MLRSIQIADYMNPAPVKVHVNDSLAKAADIITSERVSGACVVDSDGHLVGMLSEIDCLRALILATYNNTADIGSVNEAMTAEVQTCSPQDNIIDVAMDMISKGHRRRPVVAGGKLLGQLTCRQIMRVMSGYNETTRA